MKNYFKLICFLFSFLWFLSIHGIVEGQELVTEFNPVVKGSNIKTYLGPSSSIGNGTGQAWIAIDTAGKPCAVGINFTEEALGSLPATDAEYSLKIPGEGKNFFTHATVNWNPHGHEPQGVYSIPHFDFHFYIIPESERLAIGATDSIQFAKAPEAQFFPANYIGAPGGVPKMGAHWVDKTSPEFTGKPFTKTFIWGSYNGNVIFWEPMVSRSYLLTHPHDIISITQPQSFQKDGWYASNYQIVYFPDTKLFTIALTDLVFQKGQ